MFKKILSLFKFKKTNQGEDDSYSLIKKITIVEKKKSELTVFTSEEKRHKELISQGFIIPADFIKSLNSENRRAIEKYGSWMEALESGSIKPITEEQKRFLNVCKGYQNPHNKIEIAWYNYKKIKSRLSGGTFGYHSNGYKQQNYSSYETCNSCDRKIDFCICSQ